MEIEVNPVLIRKSLRRLRQRLNMVAFLNWFCLLVWPAFILCVLTLPLIIAGLLGWLGAALFVGAALLVQYAFVGRFAAIDQTEAAVYADKELLLPGTFLAAESVDEGHCFFQAILARAEKSRTNLAKLRVLNLTRQLKICLFCLAVLVAELFAFSAVSAKYGRGTNELARGTGNISLSLSDETDADAIDLNNPEQLAALAEKLGMTPQQLLAYLQRLEQQVKPGKPDSPQGGDASGGIAQDGGNPGVEGGRIAYSTDSMPKTMSAKPTDVTTFAEVPLGLRKGVAAYLQAVAEYRQRQQQESEAGDN